MPRPLTAWDLTPLESGSVVGGGIIDEAGPESLVAIKAYLDYRARGVDPPRSLAQAWDSFYRFYALRIRTFLKGRGLSEPDRNDCFQEVWRAVIEQLSCFGHDPARARLSTWMMTLARHKAADVIRRRSRLLFESLGEDESAGVMDPGPDPATAYERGRTRAQVRCALAELSRRVSPTSFRVFYLRWIEGRPTAEVAAALSLTPEQVRFRACRMKRKVRRCLEQVMSGEDNEGAASRPVEAE